jgi:hypothetical protein
MKLEFVVEFLFDDLSPNEGTPPQDPIPEKHRALLYVLSRTWATAELSLRQMEISVSSRARPLLVSS